MSITTWLNLQLFAGDGAGTGTGGDGGAGEAATGAEEAVDAGRQRLLELGVPADKIRKRAYKPAAKAPAAASAQEQGQQANEQAAAVENPAEEKAETAPRLSWAEIMADPEYNAEMQRTVQARLRSSKASEDAMQKLAPALELLAKKHGIDPEKMDYEALSSAITDDEDLYEQKALEMGVSKETARETMRQEKENAIQQREEAQTLEQQRIQQHIQKLQQQGEEMKKIFPNFDLRKELQNPAFVRMTSPNVGISVEDAYYAVHRKEIQTASMQVTAQKTAEKLSNSIQSGQRRPAENGTSGQAASVNTSDYRNMSPEQRNALKRRIRSGEKVYPGQM